MIDDQQPDQGKSDEQLGADDISNDVVFIGSPEDFAIAFVNGWIVDGRSGGLVRGRLHEEGHIPLIQPSYSSVGSYEYVGVMEGGEYIMSTAATAAHFERLKDINDDKSPCDAPLPAAVAGRVIHVSAEPHDKLLVVEAQYIINRVSTRRHLAELISLNEPHIYSHGQIFSDDEVAYFKGHPELGSAPPN